MGRFWRDLSWQERFWLHVVKTDDCWLWNGNPNRYGKINTDAEAYVAAHRLSFEIHIGPIPEGTWVLHRCDTPGCVRPAHLFLGTAVVNSRDRANKGRNGDQRGERNGSVVLTAKQVDAIRHRYRTENASMADLAAAFGVTEGAIQPILENKHWRHLVSAQIPHVGHSKGSKGEKNNHAKIGLLDVCTIRVLHESGDYSYAELARRWGLTRAAVRFLVTRRTWKHVPHVA